MNYKKFTNNAYNLHVIKTDKFKTVMIKINLKKKVKKEDITYRNLLTKVLLESTKNYPTRRDLEIATEELYNLSVSATNALSGNYIITTINAFFLNDKYIEEDIMSKALTFVFDFLINPNVKNKEFAFFDLGKRLVNDEVSTLKDNPKKYSQLRLLEEMDKKSSLAFNPIGYLDDLDNITNNKLFKYYENMLKTDLIDIFIIGDVDSEEIKKQITNIFKVNTLKKPSESHFLTHHKLRSRTKTVKEQADLEQAKLNIGFKLSNLTEFERKYVLNIYAFILGGGPDSKLFKNVREKHSLCYNISCTHKPVANVMVISAGIDSNDFKKCLNLIKKELVKMNKGDFEDKDLEAAKITYINSLKDIEDFEPSLLKIFESHEYLDFDLLDERTKSIQNVTKQDVVNLAKKIKIDTIYLLEGVNHEEDGN